MKEAAIGIIFFEQKVLLVKRRDLPVWVLPGGGIDENESPELACIREVKEETGLEVTISRKVGTWLPVNRIGAAMHVFECEILNRVSALAPQEESLEVGLFSLSDLPKPLFFLQKSLIDKALEHAPQKVYLMTELTYWRLVKTALSHPIFAVRYLLSRLGLPLNT